MRYLRKMIIFLYVILIPLNAKGNSASDTISPLYANAAGLDLMSDVPWVVNKDEIIPFFFTHPVDSDLTNDSIKHQKTKSDASRVTLGKIALESLGALSGGLILVIPISVLAGEDGTQWGYLFGFSIGPAIGTTFTGNKLMEPNGSFVGSLAGSTIGMLLGGGIYVAHVMSGIFSDNFKTNNAEILCLSVAMGLPILGATTGYNLGVPEISRGTINFNEDFDDFNEMAQLQRAKYKLSLISVKF
ncbi:MAG: hypothetical protein ABIL86_07655 [candidate division WOR-3 bacterium]